MVQPRAIYSDTFFDPARSSSVTCLRHCYRPQTPCIMKTQLFFVLSQVSIQVFAHHVAAVFTLSNFDSASWNCVSRPQIVRLDHYGILFERRTSRGSELDSNISYGAVLLRDPRARFNRIFAIIQWRRAGTEYLLVWVKAFILMSHRCNVP